MNAPHQPLPVRKPVSPLEQDYAPYVDRTIDAADHLKLGAMSAGLLMRDLNRMHQVVAGLGVVLRIINGNVVLEDEFDPDVRGSVAPLSKAATSTLTAMAAVMCEEMRDAMALRANEYNRQVKA